VSRPRRRAVRRVLGLAWLGAIVALLAAVAAGHLAGWRFDVVQTSSMEPAVPTGSLAVVAPVEPAAVRVGDVVAFRPPADADRVVLHRVTRVSQGRELRYFQTKGDANDEADATPVPVSAVEGRLRWHLRGIGPSARFLTSPKAPLALVGIPLLLLAVAELVRLLRSRSAGANPPASA
jgi:signal peptidase